MATGISANVEYRRPGDSYWLSVTAGGFRLFPDYLLFGALAGVRGSKSPLFAPRGLPQDLTFDTAQLLGWCLQPESAEVPHGYTRTQQIGSRWLLAGPESFGCSWLTLTEIQAALQHHGGGIDELDIEFPAVLAAMERLAVVCGGEGVRLIFWFDG